MPELFETLDDYMITSLENKENDTESSSTEGKMIKFSIDIHFFVDFNGKRYSNQSSLCNKYFTSLKVCKV